LIFGNLILILIGEKAFQRTMLDGIKRETFLNIFRRAENDNEVNQIF